MTSSNIPRWNLSGDWFDVCKCKIPCPCAFAQTPTYGDYDGVVDSQDNCPSTPNPDQKNTNGDEYGDACQMGDQDNDGITDFKDNCRYAANPDQKDEDNDGFGDACENIIL